MKAQINPNEIMIQEEKRSLRKQMLLLLKQQQASPDQLSALLKKIGSLPEWRAARSVLLYAPLPSEPNLLQLLDNNASRRFFFPRMQGEELYIYEWFPAAPWIVGRYGISEPDPSCWQSVSLAEVDLALIPGLAFDQQGGRLGWGRGYFDRLLGNPECHAFKVGVAWLWQIVPAVPREKWDVLMNCVVTG